MYVDHEGGDELHIQFERVPKTDRAKDWAEFAERINAAYARAQNENNKIPISIWEIPWLGILVVDEACY